ncbi:hypothetical protein [Sulfitobacter sp. W074]|uniref:hypothetical protein n=1 Tax=Sulfitobacter sp. W074 TaxID=2867026 RepID=UPI0021A69F3B|nr:hypothetical protein [Sulfitobacter sp. W074]UWR38373.1 hypothetical protein K3762_04900 [Sulfitobacter sp. W074]
MFSTFKPHFRPLPAELRTTSEARKIEEVNDIADRISREINREIRAFSAVPTCATEYPDWLLIYRAESEEVSEWVVLCGDSEFDTPPEGLEILPIALTSADVAHIHADPHATAERVLAMTPDLLIELFNDDHHDYTDDPINDIVDEMLFG